MLNSVTPLRFLLLVLTFGLYACSSGGGSDDPVDPVDPVDEIPVAPVFTSTVSGDGVVELKWTHIDEPSGDGSDGAPILLYNLYYANATDTGTTIDDLAATYTEVADIEAVAGYQVVESISALEYSVTGLDNLDLYYFILTAVAAEEEEGVVSLVEGDASAIEAFAMPRASVVSVQALNDTGVTLCGDYSFGIDVLDVNDDGILSFEEIDVDGDELYFENDNRIDCFSGEEDDDMDPIPALTQQDYAQGLDATANDDSDGAAGFSFTKLDAAGAALAADAADWSCVQDNVTGLIWEAKTSDEDDLHYSKDHFSWFNDDTTVNGEEDGYEVPSGAVANGGEGDDICFGYTEGDAATYCNTSAFIDRVNTEALCGFSDWRLPNMVELRSLVDYGTENEDVDDLVASVDLNYFPNTEIDGGLPGTTIDGGIWYWTTETYSASPTAAWAMYFGYGGAPILNKGTPNVVRLVRSDP